MADELAPFCDRYHHAIELIGRRWSGAIVRAMLTGSTRFGEIRHAIPGISDRLLSERLKELETEGVLRREVIPDTPVRVEYHLTDMGSGLADVVRSVSDWAARWIPAADAPHDRAPAR